MKIALVSLEQVWEDKKANFDRCKEYVEKASKNQAELVIFPEMTLTSYSVNVEKIAEDEDNSDTIKWFQKIAKEQNIAILFGVVLKKNGRVKNYAVFVDNKGVILTKYAKIHPFSFAGEDRYFNAGDKLSIVKYDGLFIGLSICYDLRFPELFSALGKRSDIIVNIANWPKKRVDHWNTLLGARAIENQLFMIGVNRIGKDGNGLEYEESSNVFNANGELVKFADIDKMKVYEIDKNFTQEFRNSFNTVNDRKPEFYKEVLQC